MCFTPESAAVVAAIAAAITLTAIFGRPSNVRAIVEAIRAWRRR